MEQTYMKEKPILPLLLSMALPNGAVNDGQFSVQHYRRLFCGKDQ